MAVTRGGDTERRGILDAIDTPAAVVDAQGIVRLVNAAWTEFGRANAMTDEACGVGASYAVWLDEAPQVPQVDDQDARRAGRGVFDVIHGRADGFQMVYPCHAPAEERWFRLVVAPLAVAAPRPVLTVHVRLADRFGAREYGERAPATRPVVCAWCRERRRDDGGRWVAIDDPAVLDGDVSHGICPTCVEQFA